MARLVSPLLPLLKQHQSWVVLSGAGVSARSGIPTYRDSTGKWLRTEPIQHQAFLSSDSQRRRYWGRSMVGWPGVRDARPNAVHRALAALERLGLVDTVITQNVDRLHQRAGSQQVIDLHGRLDRVCCLDCGVGYDREDIQQRLQRLNPQHRDFTLCARPDGDADLDDTQVASVKLVDCSACGGLLMPDVVFFGGIVPRARVEACQRAIANADALLVLGSSLQVYSGYRWCKQAKQLGKPLYIANEGITRADHLADVKIDEDALSLFLTAAEAINALMTGDSPCPAQ